MSLPTGFGVHVPTNPQLLDSLSQSSGYDTPNSDPESTLSASTHLLLTNYGPKSATDHLRDNLDILTKFSCICGEPRNSDRQYSHSQSSPEGSKGRGQASTATNAPPKNLNHLQPTPVSPSLQELLPKQVNYESLLCTAPTDAQDTVATDRIRPNSSLSDMSRCVHNQSHVSKRYDPPYCHDSQSKKGWLTEISIDEFLEIVKYVSFDDLKNLRLVNKAFAKQLRDTRFQSVVCNFGPDIFKASTSGHGNMLQEKSLFHIHGHKIQKFGIAFEIDLNGLHFGRVRKNAAAEDSFWGSYKWPGNLYPRYSQLRDLEKLGDDVETIRTAMSQPTNVSELGLSIDSGHGWLAGADQSDMAVYRSRCKGSKVFKRRFTMDRNFELAHGVLFESAQMQTLRLARVHNDKSSLLVRPRPWFTHIGGDAEAENAKHTGISKNDLTLTMASELRSRLSVNQTTQILQLCSRHPGHPLIAPSSMPAPNFSGTSHVPLYFYHQTQGLLPNAALDVPQLQPHVADALINGVTASTDNIFAPRKYIEPERSALYPLIFNGVNLRAAAEGLSTAVQSQVHDPANFPLKPNQLTEAQAQWLLDTFWAQQAFLASYITSVIANRAILGRNIRSLCIPKISSGLLKSLADTEFWAALPKLEAITLLVIPDWRKEPVIRDESRKSGKLIAPLIASLKLKAFLEKFIAPLENISDLIVGFASGGEHATGMLARNNHVLPAPLASNPKDWLVTREQSSPNRSALSSSADASTLLTLEHVANLTLRNCWITPRMLRTFMKQQHDTSLKTLTLQSVSLTTQHTDIGLHGDIHFGWPQLPKFGKSAWLQEKLPTTDCWPALLDSITPGKTFLRKKYDADLISHDELVEAVGDPPPFRGNIERIILRSCGYVYITSGVHYDEFNQITILEPDSGAMDPGLRPLHTALERHAMYLGAPVIQANSTSDDDGNDNGDGDGTVGQDANAPNNNNPTAHLDGFAGNRPDSPMLREHWPLMGKIVQAIFPVEKRVLEQGFGMRFGWGRSLARWGPVEDGCLEGGTGRFSGVVQRE